MARGLLVVALGAILVSGVQPMSRSRRHVIDLAAMLKYSTGRNPMDFVDYGHWCGLGGNGTFVDELDKCCMEHDKCYDNAAEKECFRKRPHIVRYTWKYQNEEITCAPTNHECASAICTCDRALAVCLTEHIDSYNTEHLSDGRRHRDS